MSNFYFGIPFWFKVIDDFDDDDNVNDTYLIITDEDDGNDYDWVPPEIQDATPSYEDYLDKKIISINDTNPFEFIENLFSIFPSGHNSQINYVNILDTIQNINIIETPFFKEELSNIKLEFEDGEEYTFNYTFSEYVSTTAIQRYYLEKLNKNINNNLPPPNYRAVYEEFKFKYKSNNKKVRKMETVEWDLESKEGQIKCKVDEDYKKNVFFQNSFSTDNFDDYETVMLACLDKFYSNDYEIIVIESSNGGGYSELCFPMAQYLRPKILGTALISQKDTDLNYEYFIDSDENLNYETCKPYFNREGLYRGTTDNYGDAIHNRTKEIKFYSIYSKK